MDIALLIGRILFGGFFLLSGLNHFMKKKAMVEYAKSKGLPSPGLAVGVSGLVIILGGLGLILGVYVKTSIVLLLVFLVLVSFMMHRFWTINDPQWRAIEMVNFLKNLALAGALLMFWSLSWPWPYAISL